MSRFLPFVLLAACHGGGGDLRYVRFERVASTVPARVDGVGDDIVGIVDGALVRVLPEGHETVLTGVNDYSVAPSGAIHAATTSGVVRLDTLASAPVTLSTEVFAAIQVQGDRLHAMRADDAASFAWVASDDEGANWVPRSGAITLAGVCDPSVGFSYADDDLVVGGISGDADCSSDSFSVASAWYLLEGDGQAVLSPEPILPPLGISPGGIAVAWTDTVNVPPPTSGSYALTQIAWKEGFSLDDGPEDWNTLAAVGVGTGLRATDGIGAPAGVDAEGRIYVGRSDGLNRTTESVDVDLSDEVLVGPGCGQRDEPNLVPNETTDVDVTFDNATGEDVVVLWVDDQNRWQQTLPWVVDPELGVYVAPVTPAGGTLDFAIQPGGLYLVLGLDERCLAFGNAPKKDDAVVEIAPVD